MRWDSTKSQLVAQLPWSSSCRRQKLVYIPSSSSLNSTHYFYQDEWLDVVCIAEGERTRSEHEIISSSLKPLLSLRRTEGWRPPACLPFWIDLLTSIPLSTTSMYIYVYLYSWAERIERFRRWEERFDETQNPRSLRPFPRSAEFNSRIFESRINSATSWAQQLRTR